MNSNKMARIIASLIVAGCFLYLIALCFYQESNKVNKSTETPLTELQGETFTDDEEHELTVINGYRVAKKGRFVFVYEVFYRDGSEIKYRFLGENVKVRIDAEDGQYNYMVKDTIHIHNFNEIQRRK